MNFLFDIGRYFRFGKKPIINMQTNKPVIILGGTFDPIHNGHLEIANLVLQKLNTACVHFIPCNLPATKDLPIASAAHRLKMLKIALEDKKIFVANAIEIKRGGISYMIDTLHELQKKFPSTPLCLILGEDAFLQLPTWKKWQELQNYCHFIVLKRKHNNKIISAELQKFITKNTAKNINDMLNLFSGKIFFLPIKHINISSTEIRSNINTEKTKKLLPEKVYTYIKQHKLYN